MIFNFKRTVSRYACYAFFTLSTTNAFSEDRRCADFALDERASDVKAACDNFAEELLPQEIPAGVLNCDNYANETRDKCTVFINAGKAFMARPDVAAEYEKYTKRARLIAVIISAFNHKMQVIDYYLNHGKYPNSNSQAGIKEAIHDKDVAGIDIGDNGVITISTSPELAIDGAIILTPTPQSNNSIEFDCASRNIDKILLPKQCQAR